MARCIALDIDCAVICQLAAAAMARDSTAARGICALVVDVCTDCSDCADECAAVLMNKHIFEYERESP